MKDIRYGLRLLAKSPGFTAVAVLSLALGIGANTAIFTLIDAVLLRMLPVSHPQELVSLNLNDGTSSSGTGSANDRFPRSIDGDSSTAFPYPAFEHIRARNSVFTNLIAFKGLGRLNVQIGTESELARGQLVTADYFPTLGVRPILGRDFTDGDDRAGAEPVAIISHGYWQRRFGGDPAVVGKSMTMNGIAVTVAGVTPPEFYGLQPGSPIDMSLPFTVQPRLVPNLASPGVSLFAAPNQWWIELMGRLKPGVSEQQARSNLDVVYRQAIEDAVIVARKDLKGDGSGKPLAPPAVELVPGGRGLNRLRGQFSKPLWILMTVVAAVLLIACANVANLLLARATARQKEIAVRLSLGATRMRLIRQLLIESVLLSSLGGLAGLLVAYWGSGLLVAMMQRGNDRLVIDVHPDLKVLAFNAAACVLTGLLFGLAPAFRATRVDLTPALKQSGATLGSSRERMRLTKSLVVLQVALSLVLLCGAGLFIRTLMNLQTQNVGFARDNLLLFGIAPREAGYKGARYANLCREIQARAAALPGVTSATASLHLLLSGSMRGNSITVPGYTAAPKEDTSVAVLPVGDRFLATMGIPLLQGRDLTIHDDENALKVALINQTMASKYWPGQDPVGKHFMLSKLDMEVVGIVQDAKYTSLRRDTQPTVYHPLVQNIDSMPHMHFEVRTQGDATALIPEIRRVVAAIDNRLPLFDVRTQTQQIDELLLQERLFAKLTGFFGTLALILVCLGLYGIMSYAVARRTSEIGVRMALGAQRWNILKMVLGEVLLLIGIGAVLGTAGSLVAAKLADSAVSGLLYGLKTTDATVIAAATVLMLAVGAFAGFLPARRASRVDPMVALRYE